MDAEVFLACACELLAIPSTSERPGELRRALDYVLDFVGPGFTVERFESGGKPSALVYAGAERRNFDVILNAHLDVVPAPPGQFRPRRDGDRLFARGPQDMKVSGLLAAQVFRELAARLPHPVALQLVTDEEVGGRDGTLHQLERGVRGRFVVVGETSGLRIVNESKGMLVVRLLAAGRGAHAAYQWLGDNALVKLQQSVASLLARYPIATEEAWRTTVNLSRVPTRTGRRSCGFRTPLATWGTRVTCSANTVSATGDSTASWASPPSRSAWTARASMARTSTPTSPRCCPTTTPCASSSAPRPVHEARYQCHRGSTGALILRRRRSRWISRPSFLVSRRLNSAPAAAPVSIGPRETALRPARTASRRRSSRASGDPAAKMSPPSIMNTPRRWAH
ncbi:MAG TPA: M20/M25/M40 family metallo-hydrolase, partial [Streptosporangiaceae bacterium]|nr:M20/M25/M40 family metallo-hydrolase [Streptosporangiaceae bacterium]